MEAWRSGAVSVRADIRSLHAPRASLLIHRDSSARIDKHFASSSDPRRGDVTYPPINIVAIALCATVVGADDFVAIADRARQERDRLGQLLDLPGAIPSHGRFNAVFRALKPGPSERCPVSWINALHQVAAGQLVAIDGATLRQGSDEVGAAGGSRIRCTGDGT